MPRSGASGAERAATISAVIAEIAREKLADVDALAEQGLHACVATVPELRADDAIFADSRRSMRANLERMLEQFAAGPSAEAAEPPPEALEMATTVLRRGGDPEMLARAYLRGPRWSLEGWLQAIKARVDDPALVIEVFEEFSRRYFDYMERTVDRVIEHYQAERRRWIDSAKAHRAEIVRSVLQDPDMSSVDKASQTLGFELGRPLVPAVLWSTDEGSSVASVLAGLEELASGLARDLGAQKALTAPAGSSTLWIWIGLDRAVDVARVAELAARRCGEFQYVAIGSIDSGLAGFRNGHQEAVHAQHVANTSVSGARVFRYDDLELVSLMAEEQERMRRFVSRALGGLTDDDPATARLRETLAVYFAEGANARCAAERLNVHKNTVLYRIRSAESLLGRPIDERRLELELALKIAQTLGNRALTPRP